MASRSGVDPAPRSGGAPSFGEAVEQVARRRYAAMVARLVRALGPAQLELAEDVVQEAFVRALRAWPASGMPDEPERWLYRVAKNLALDGLRRRSLGPRIESELGEWALARGESEGPAAPAGEALDDTLRMMFLCAHPSLPPESRSALVLKSVCGFGNAEIAAALLAKEATIAQRLTRAKARLVEEHASFELPPPARLIERLDVVLESLYLLFNEGYRAHRGEQLVRVDLVYEAARLTRLLTEHPHTDQPATHALLALVFLTGARVPARTNALGELLTLAEQDRTLWERSWLSAGMTHFRRAAAGERVTAYHIEAAIASLHACAPTYEATNWGAILREYDRLLALRDDPIVRLNRAVALAKVYGAARGLAELDALGDEGPLAGYQLRLATRAHLLWDLGAHADATRALEAALLLPCTEPERRLLERRLTDCRRQSPPAPW
ncbi:MAG: sigma-70 family RNA polymerase sigma factor [Planctomycetota bacterium]